MTSTNTTSDNSSMSHLLMPSVPASSDVSFCCMSLILYSLIQNCVKVISWNRLETIIPVHSVLSGVEGVLEPHFSKYCQNFFLKLGQKGGIIDH